MKVALVAGALGVVGRALMERLEGDGEWRAVGLSRRKPDFPSRSAFVSVDLQDRAQCEARLAAFSDVTHLFVTTYAPRPDPAEEAATGLAMLRNLVETVERAAPGLVHVNLVHGSKWYGNQLGPYKTPAREDDPGHMPPNFYFDQQRWVERRRAEGARWSWSALRPHGIWGFAIGSPVNQMTALAVYGSISRHLGLPLRFPGKPGAFEAVYQMVEATHLAEGMLWAATSPSAADRAYNFTNGDLIRWVNVWPAIAGFFGCEPGGVQTISLVQMMADKEPLWAEIVRRHDLQPYRLADLVDWRFADFVYGSDYDHISSMTRARQAGWTKVVDTEEMILRKLGELRDRRIIP